MIKKYKVKYMTNHNEKGESESEAYIDVEAEDEDEAFITAQEALDEKMPFGDNEILDVVEEKAWGLW